MTPIEQFFPYVLPSVPGCSDILAIQAIRSSAISFCTRTDIIQQIIVADVVANTKDYTITSPTDMDLARVMSVTWQGRVLTPVSPDVVSQDVVLRGVTIGTAQPTFGDPRYYFQATSNDEGFGLYPIPDTALVGGLTIRASFAPTNTATTVDDVLFRDWVEDIAAGAIAGLMVMPGQAFSSMTSAKVYGAQFVGAVNRAKRQKNTGRITNGLRVMPQRFAV